MKSNLKIEISLPEDVGLDKIYYKTGEAREILGLLSTRAVIDMLNYYGLTTKTNKNGWRRIPVSTMKNLILCKIIREQTGLPMTVINKYKLWEQLKL